MSLFDFSNENENKKLSPLADRMRPRNLDEFFGQSHIVGKGRLLRRAIEADFAYMAECGVLTEDGLMGEDEYVEDDAFEVLLDMLADDPEDDEEMDRLAQMLDSYMEAQAAFMEESGLADE